MLILVAVLLAVVSVVLVARALSPVAATNRRIAHVQLYGLAASPGMVLDIPAEDEVERSPTAIIGRAIAPLIGRDRVDTVRRNLLAAGNYGTSAEAFLGTQALMAVAAVGLSGLAATSIGAPPATTISLVALSLFAGIAGPPSTLSRRARERLSAIDKEMPELVDLVVVAVEAGLGLFAALDRAAGRMVSPLGDELRLVLQEHGLGASTADALNHLADRCDTPGVRSFCRTLVQGERLGISIGQMMRAVAEDMRKRRMAHAEEAAHKAPIKILFPLVFCVFPSLLVILIVPAAMNVLEGIN